MIPITINDFSKFGYRERKIAEQLLHAWNEQGLPEDFTNDEVSIIMNTHSGCVFLTNSDFQVAMMNGEKLESFYTDSETGEEGFKDELSQEALERLGFVKPVEVEEETTYAIIDGVDFDRHDRRLLEYLLTAWNEGNLPGTFSTEGIKIVNQNGFICLTNAAKQYASLDGYDVQLCTIDPETEELTFEE